MNKLEIKGIWNFLTKLEQILTVPDGQFALRENNINSSVDPAYAGSNCCQSNIKRQARYCISNRLLIKHKVTTMEFRNRPKSNYLQNAEWQELHVLTAHWQSDMIFFEDELRFIDVLFDKYFTELIDTENIGQTKVVAGKIAEVKTKQASVAQQIKKHLNHIEALMLNPFVQNASAFREEHAALEDDLTVFVKDFRAVKHAIFELTERIARTEKAKHLIAN